MTHRGRWCGRGQQIMAMAEGGEPPDVTGGGHRELDRASGRTAKPAALLVSTCVRRRQRQRPFARELAESPAAVRVRWKHSMSATAGNAGLRKQPPKRPHRATNSNPPVRPVRPAPSVPPTRPVCARRLALCASVESIVCCERVVRVSSTLRRSAGCRVVRQLLSCQLPQLAVLASGRLRAAYCFRGVRSSVARQPRPFI